MLKLACGENVRAMIVFVDDDVIYRAYLYTLEDGLVGLIIPLIVKEYTDPKVSESKNGILIRNPLTLHEDI